MGFEQGRVVITQCGYYRYRGDEHPLTQLCIPMLPDGDSKN